MIHLLIDSDDPVVFKMPKHFIFEQFLFRSDPSLDNCQPFWLRRKLASLTLLIP